MTEAYAKGFLYKCAEHGIGPREAVELMKSAQTISDNGFVLSPGQYLSGVARKWNASHPDRPITVDQIVAANNGLDPTRYVAGKRYSLPTAAAASPAATPAPPAPAQAAAPPAAAPNTAAAGSAPRHWAITDWAHKANPGTQLLYDVARSGVNRAARTLGVPDDKSIWPGGTVTSMSNDQMDWLRQAIMAQGGGTAAPSGQWGGPRRAQGKTTDDYRKFVHPGFPYAGFPNTDVPAKDTRWYKPWTWGVADKIRSADWRSTGVPNQIEHLLGDFSWSTDKDGNIIVNDTYDFNTGEGKRDVGTSYGGFRQWAGRNASSDLEPDSQKTKYRVNLGNPSTWGGFDEAKFRAFNEPYRKKFPGMYHYNPSVGDDGQD